MIITKNFVLINFPKTGTTFVRSVLKAIHEQRETVVMKAMRKLRLAHHPLREIMLPKLYGNYPSSYQDQHGVYRQIPRDERTKRILTICRNPLTKYISSYVFGWWKNHPPFELSLVKEEFPDFPDISFVDFYRLLNHPKVDEDKFCSMVTRGFGSYTRMFLVFYSHDPDDALKSLAKGLSIDKIIPKITFLHQETLCNDLSVFLANCGYSQSEIDIVSTCQAMNVGSRSQKIAIPLTEIEQVAIFVMKDDAAILRVFPEYLEQVAAFKAGCPIEELPMKGFCGPREVGRDLCCRKSPVD